MTCSLSSHGECLAAVAAAAVLIGASALKPRMSTCGWQVVSALLDAHTDTSFAGRQAAGHTSLSAPLLTHSHTARVCVCVCVCEYVHTHGLRDTPYGSPIVYALPASIEAASQLLLCMVSPGHGWVTETGDHKSVAHLLLANLESPSPSLDGFPLVGLSLSPSVMCLFVSAFDLSVPKAYSPSEADSRCLTGTRSS